jgi:serine/threonine protein kinase
VFERLGLSLYDFLRKNSYKPFHLDILRAFGRQLLEAVAYLHDLTLIHTDLKPENILLESSEYDKQTPPPGSRCGMLAQLDLRASSEQLSACVALPHGAANIFSNS